MPDSSGQTPIRPTPGTSTASAPIGVSRDRFVALLITDDAESALRQLTEQAEEHFGHGVLSMSDLQLHPTSVGDSLIATAHFSPALQPTRVDVGPAR